MANDINDDAEMMPNHGEAWSLAHHKRGTSNLARAYIEMRETLAAARKLIGKQTFDNADCAVIANVDAILSTVDD